MKLHRFMGFVEERDRYRELSQFGIKIIDPVKWNSAIGTIYFIVMCLLLVIAMWVLQLVNK